MTSLSGKNADANIFWGELTPCDHMVQIYEDDEIFMDSLEGYVAGGLTAGDGVVVIATETHISSLNRRLAKHDIDIPTAVDDERYIVLEADETLPQFIYEGWPDDDKFRALILGLLERARGDGRRVRAFGEFVALLWGRGHNAATVRLEHLWHRLCAEQGFSLFCAYPRIGFTDYALKSLEDIRSIHARVIG
ncbi:MAG: MEDS domain-containing protein [Acidobacteriota bacterium]